MGGGYSIFVTHSLGRALPPLANGNWRGDWMDGVVINWEEEAAQEQEPAINGRQPKYGRRSLLLFKHVPVSQRDPFSRWAIDHHLAWPDWRGISSSFPGWLLRRRLEYLQTFLVISSSLFPGKEFVSAWNSWERFLLFYDGNPIEQFHRNGPRRHGVTGYADTI